MFFVFFQLYTFTRLIPLVLSLNITLGRAPEPFQNTPISLRWAQDDPSDFVLGALTIDGLMMTATMVQTVTNFTTDRIVNITFNYTSPFGKDCILLAWLPQAEPRNCFTESEPFSVKSGSFGRIITSMPGLEPTAFQSTFPSTSAMASSPATSNSTSSVSGTVSNVPPKLASHTGMIVGGVLSLLALGCMASVSIYVLLWRPRSKAGSLPLLRPQDKPALTLAPFLLKHSSKREAGAQEYASAVSRDHLEAEIARVREEIRALRLDNQIRRMEAGYESLPPPSYRSASSYSRSTSFDT
ncbi:hypothetical protein ARMSODRAFT_961988 [Armillaria solidipes]|uniref:Mid2 domain-containing protein n=1 Tax=Armillaria solidipes TaxID=1076256 RepID=A0A2H3BKV7_9AGAR|nr:hypothetical protein ARMSODRAFT_961988 [Armillaria solidipes]